MSVLLIVGGAAIAAGVVYVIANARSDSGRSRAKRGDARFSHDENADMLGMKPEEYRVYAKLQRGRTPDQRKASDDWHYGQEQLRKHEGKYVRTTRGDTMQNELDPIARGYRGGLMATRNGASEDDSNRAILKGMKRGQTQQSIQREIEKVRAQRLDRLDTKHKPAKKAKKGKRGRSK